MALTSMTGFARRDGRFEAWRFAWEMRSVNGRGLDLRFRTPQGFDAVEAKARALAGDRLARGTVSVGLTVAREGSGRVFQVDTDLLEALIATAGRYADRPGVTPASIDGLLAIRGVVDIVDALPDEAAQKGLEEALLAAFDATLDDFVAARRQEGAALLRILSAQVDEIARLAAEAEALPARTPEAIKARLLDQLSVLLAREDIDPARLHQEAALLATRADVREELDRLSAHVAQARDLLAAEGAVGRRLDFLAQEFNRETNTLCSKSNDTELTRIGLALKATVDQFKEQVQNIE
ncbi:YicC/YloC family endoribonuclease [Chthonobacter rhizosphaerae]|uniref:YicC/YloC family endoribonuclease n=1 Tax=Chthonobacter rhizosphaerae TaxID=2735553 RepID=UPI0015EF19BA|nr:YicC/YloC family endoribonuclease [Chthonobacter rhizosphaerae]